MGEDAPTLSRWSSIVIGLLLLAAMFVVNRRSDRSARELVTVKTRVAKAGTVLADEVTDAVEFADLDLLSDSLLGDQILIDRRGNPRDIGDSAFIGLSFNLDVLGNGALSGGPVDFELSLGFRCPAEKFGESVALTD